MMDLTPLKINGKTYLQNVLLRFDYPIIFTAINEIGQMYLYYLVGTDEKEGQWDKWLITKISNIEYLRLINGKISIKNVIDKGFDNYAEVVKYLYSSEEAVVLSKKEFYKYLPKQHRYVDIESIESYNEEIINSILQKGLSIPNRQRRTSIKVKNRKMVFSIYSPNIINTIDNNNVWSLGRNKTVFKFNPSVISQIKSSETPVRVVCSPIKKKKSDGNIVYIVREASLKKSK